MKKYKILFNWGSHEGFAFQDEEFDSVSKAVAHAIGLNYSTPFLIVNVIDWEAIQKCPYPDCPRVKYHDCPIHGEVVKGGIE